MERKNSLVDFWFANPSYWFSKTEENDHVITQMFEDMLEDGDITMLGNIILYDQVPRHIYRKEQANHIISYFLEKAVIFSNILRKFPLSDEEWVFVALPYRHKGTNMKYVVDTAWSRYEASNSPIMRRFIKATYDRMSLSHNIMRWEPSFRFPIFNCSKYANILEFDPGVVKYIEPNKHQIQLDLPDEMIISLSGGVDSMVCLDIMRNYKKVVRAVHVNYCNRGDESMLEEEFVRAWCDFMGIEVYVVRIDEINREQCMKHKFRDLYEKYTRKQRFMGYKKAMKDPVVLLGHNKDDVLENIFTNIANHTKYDNLNGMSIVSYEDGITFQRPLLQTPKDDIIAYARFYNIPYLKNSTPAWSQRGQIRNSVVPVLMQWNPKIIKGLYRLAEEMQNLDAIIDHIDYNRIPKTRSVHFWQKILGKKVSQKSIENFINRIHAPPGKFRVVLKKDYVIKGVSYEDHISIH